MEQIEFNVSELTRQLFNTLQEVFVVLNNYEVGLEQEIFFKKDSTFRSLKDVEGFIETNGLNEITKYINETDQQFDIAEYYTRRLIKHLFADFMNYVGVSLHSMSMEKIGPAFSLTRRPMQDTLFYLEWLIMTNQVVFDIYKGNIPSYTHRGKHSNFEWTTLKTKVQENLKTYRIMDQEWLSQIDLIYTIRYERDNAISLVETWNKGLHIVTDYSQKGTKPGELNFVFVDRDVILQYTEYYYSKHLGLLMHTKDVIDILISKYFKEISEETSTIFENFAKYCMSIE